MVRALRRRQEIPLEELVERLKRHGFINLGGHRDQVRLEGLDEQRGRADHVSRARREGVYLTLNCCADRRWDAHPVRLVLGEGDGSAPGRVGELREIEGIASGLAVERLPQG